LVQQATSLRDKFLDLAYEIQEELGRESNGVIALKGIGEALDRVAVAPAHFTPEDVNKWLRVLMAEPEINSNRLLKAVLTASRLSC